MTYLQLVNAVLRRLREDEVPTVNAYTYTKLIGDFVNETKREVEDAWDWIQLRDTVAVNTQNNQFSYTLTGAGSRFRLIDAVVLTQGYFMRKASTAWMDQVFSLPNPQLGIPLWFNFNGNSNGDPNVDVYPIPSQQYTIHFNMVIPQPDLASDNDQVTVPTMPIILGAWARAIAERGEDQSLQGSEAWQLYQSELSTRIAQDVANADEETTWSVS